MSHPPHLNRDDWSSALIPFCAFKTDSNISRNSLSIPGISFKADFNFSRNPLSLPGITFPVCSSFLPTILEGQLCYKLTLNETSGQGKRNELMLLLDYNEDRSLQKSSTKNEVEESSGSTLNFDTAVESIQGVHAKVHISTLSPFIGFGGGVYKMSVIKRMTANEDFLKMPLEDRQCEVELYEDRRTRKLLEECKCVPWEMPGYQVRT